MRYGVIGSVVAASVAAWVLGGQPVEAETLRGPETTFGQGVVQSWMEVDGEGRPARIGVALSEAAVAKAGHEMIVATVPLPEAAHEAGFDHVSLDWMPHGHPPLALFSAPHFDVHFYFVSEAERLAVDPADPLYLEKAAREPARALMPAGYVPPPTLDPVPAMGVHWLDRDDPVLSGAPFEHVFIYGAWDGKVTFIEPMMTQDLLISRRTMVAEVEQPVDVAGPGWWPTRYRIDFDEEAGMHHVVLEGFTWREPGDGKVQAAARVN